MKAVRLVARPDPAAAPALFGLVADAPYVTETRLLAWNVAAGTRVTGLLDVRGEGERLAAALRAESPVRSVSSTRLDAARYVLLIEVGVEAVGMLEEVLGSLTRGALIVVKPVVYRDGRVHVRLVGTAATVQAAVDGLPDLVDVDVRAVGDYHPDTGLARAALSERQRDALEAALDLGYYDRPRRATHEDVADRLDCAPSTASEHLQRAEAKLARAALADGARGPRNA